MFGDYKPIPSPWRQAPEFDRTAYGRTLIDEEILRPVEIGRVALGPAEVGEIPVERLHREALLDARGGEDGRHAREGGVAMGEHAARRFLCVGLQQAVRRQRVSHRQERRGGSCFGQGVPFWTRAKDRNPVLSS